LRPRLRRAPFVLAVACALILLATDSSASASSTYSRGSSTLSWLELSLYRIGSGGFDVPRENRAAALVAVAVYDAVAHAQRGSERYAAAGAATPVLQYLFPAKRTELAAQAAGYERIDPAAYSIGAAYGAAAVSRARHDGAGRKWHGTPPQGPARWAPTPPKWGAPIEPLAGTWRPWNLRSPSEFRPGPPPAPGTPEFAADEQKVYETSQALTAGEIASARYWASRRSAWSLAALRDVRRARLSERAAARVFAGLLVAEDDATIACWDTKYHYWSVRPVTAIRRDIDSLWTPLLPTPLWPSYVSAHATISAAAAVVLGHFFPRHARALYARARAAAQSRVFAGVHFPTDNAVGLVLGRRVGRIELARLPRLSRLLQP
jgi:membrane-associated phospholipid phosphatase